jgi:bacterioferritin
MAIKLSELLELLNKDLELEYSAMVQYVQHSGVLTGAEYGDITKEIKIHANEEPQHAIILAEQIDYLGGFPTANVPSAATSKDN